MRSSFPTPLPLYARLVCIALSGCLIPPITRAATTTTQKRARSTPFFSREKVKIIGTFVGAALGITLAVLSYADSKKTSPSPLPSPSPSPPPSHQESHEEVSEEPDTTIDTFVLFHQIKEAHKSRVFSVAWNKTGTRFASGINDEVKVSEFDSEQKKPVKEIIKKKSEKVTTFRPVAFHPKSDYLAYASKTGGEPLLTVLNVEDKKEKNYRAALAKPIQAIAWHPNGDSLATANKNSLIQVYTTDTTPSQLKKKISLKDPEDVLYEITSLAYHPTKNLLALGSNKQSKLVIVWDVEAGRQYVLANEEAPDKADAPHKGFISAIIWHPDGTRLVSADSNGIIRVWDTTSHEPTKWNCLYSLQHFDNKTPFFSKGVTSLSISQDGRYLASAGKNGSVKIWEITTQPITPYQALAVNKGHVTSLSFHGEYLLAGTKEGAITIWQRIQQ